MEKISSQSIAGLILILIGAVISLIAFFIIKPENDFITSVIIGSIGFIMIAFGGIILKARIGLWIKN